MAEGFYFAIVTNSNGCLSDTSNSLYYILSHISELTEDGITIYPVPANNILTVKSEFITNDYIIEIDNMLGQPVYRDYLTSNIKEINLSEISEGFYLLKFNNSKCLIVKKIVIER